MNEMNPAFKAEGTYRSDALIAGDHPTRTIGVSVKSGENLTRGALLGTDGTDYLLSLSGASDGSEDPVAILGEDVDASEGAVDSFAYVAGDFNVEAMTFGTAHTADSVRDALHARSIYLHNSVSA